MLGMYLIAGAALTVAGLSWPPNKDFVTEKVEQPGFETLPRRSVP